ncbi:hypothetical protein [Amycolatopsis keratiniphila]|uniref:Uncharacterized protein n=1 Tax=Amycolatopsis keratiniphila subsp. keratiniphila TaxID=227715 RepID=A0A1W2M3H3_9PSEU|nr:hypothetical protein [Amycolatopsis keratiniphila]ONF74715.1 hypothetical protein AVR91_0200640 [Amycolatopsis keratiniphila subsp. keratiniphila]
MSEPKDPEKLLADALRAQAVFAPSTERLSETTSDKPVETDTERSDVSGKSELPPQYGLLSGAGADSLERERVALEDAETARLAERPTPPPPVSPPLPAYWVLLLAVLLGLAAGSVIGLLTLI